MTHFGIICPPGAGHLNPMTAIGHELRQRSHRVTIFTIPDGERTTLTAGLEFRAIGEQEFPRGAHAEFFAQLGKMSGLAGLRYTINRYEKGTAVFLRDAPPAMKEAGVEAVLVDQTHSEGETIAAFLDIPFITVCNALVLNREPDIPPFCTPWFYSSAWWARLRNRIIYSLVDRAGKTIKETIKHYRLSWKLPPYSHIAQYYSQLAQLSQQPPEFEFPRHHLPNCFHFTGPYSNSTIREPTPFPWEKLTGKPLIYASMGTIHNRFFWVFRDIASACAELDVQLVISLGNSAGEESLSEWAGNPLVVRYAPQLELLQKATLTITHSGLNTTLESLSNGVPMVAIPMTYDHPAIGARIVWTGTGEVVPLGKVSRETLREAERQVLTEDSYKKNARSLQEAIKRAGGVSRAADIIEKVVATGKPVMR
ncbi:MAG: glycosyltransferase [Prochloron sp. SP5CPC1]|nr:glycosyltransferase [Candidatus Paraprochloron terpiosi SP5CPC1]